MIILQRGLHKNEIYYFCINIIILLNCVFLFSFICCVMTHHQDVSVIEIVFFFTVTNNWSPYRCARGPYNFLVAFSCKSPTKTNRPPRMPLSEPKQTIKQNKNEHGIMNFIKIYTSSSKCRSEPLYIFGLADFQWSLTVIILSVGRLYAISPASDRFQFNEERIIIQLNEVNTFNLHNFE